MLADCVRQTLHYTFRLFVVFSSKLLSPQSKYRNSKRWKNFRLIYFFSQSLSFFAFCLSPISRLFSSIMHEQAHSITCIPSFRRKHPLHNDVNNNENNIYVLQHFLLHIIIIYNNNDVSVCWISVASLLFSNTSSLSTLPMRPQSGIVKFLLSHVVRTKREIHQNLYEFACEHHTYIIS